jgi:hypothetical protein
MHCSFIIVIRVFSRRRCIKYHDAGAAGGRLDRRRRPGRPVVVVAVVLVRCNSRVQNDVQKQEACD